MTRGKKKQTLNLFLLFKTFLEENQDRHFKVHVPYDSPIEEMLRLLTGSGWKIDTKQAVSWWNADETKGGHDFILPQWMTAYQRKLLRLQQKFDQGEEENKFFVISGKKAYEILGQVAAEMREK